MYRLILLHEGTINDGAGKTLEVRRSEAEASRGKKSSSRDLERLFLDAVEDWQRPKRNLPPMPMVAEVPPPPSKYALAASSSSSGKNELPHIAA